MGRVPYARAMEEALVRGIPSDTDARRSRSGQSGHPHILTPRQHQLHPRAVLSRSERTQVVRQGKCGWRTVARGQLLMPTCNSDRDVESVRRLCST